MQIARRVRFLSLAILLNWSAIQVFSVLGTSVIVSVHKLSFENSLWILVLSNLVGFIGYLIHGWLGDRIGRRHRACHGADRRHRRRAGDYQRFVHWR